ncbi:MAG: sugar porter family MFS transporter [Pirellulaceae bacterium]
MTDEHEPVLAPTPDPSVPPSPASGKLLNEQEGSLSYLVLICFVATLGGLLFGYDTAVIAGAISFLTQHFQLSPAMEGWTAASALAGCAVGAMLAGVLSDSLGRKKVLILCAILFVISAIGTALPRTQFQFVIYRALGGIGVGAASMTSPMYIAEISPARIRGRMVSLNQLAIVFGMLAVYFVNYAIASAGSESWNVEYGWRWMFGSETFPALALLGFLFFVPESPRWLVKQGRPQEAFRVLSRVNGSQVARTEVATIKDALRHEGETIWQLFAPGMRLVLVIGVVLAILQQVTGINVFLYFATEIFQRIARSNMDAALLQTIVVGVVNMSFTIIAIWTVDHLGRKPLMVFGYVGMGVSLVALGLAAHFEQTETWVLLFMLAYIAAFALSVGPVTWVILSEIFPTKIRGRAMAIATVCLWIANFVVSQTFPMMDKNDWLVARFHHAFPFYVYAVFCLVAIVFVLAFVPETKGRTLEEIEQRWIRRRTG